MSVVGFDISNESYIIAVVRQRGIDGVLNDEPKRKTPAIVCFGNKQRFIGIAGAASSMMNPKNSISQIRVSECVARGCALQCAVLNPTAVSPVIYSINKL